MVQRLRRARRREFGQGQRADDVALPQRLVAAQEVHGRRHPDHAVQLVGERVPEVLRQAEARAADVAGEHRHPAADLRGPGQPVGLQRRAEARRGRLLVGGADETVHVGVAVSEQVEEQMTAEEAGGAGEQDPAGRERLGRAGPGQTVGEREVGQDLLQVFGTGRRARGRPGVRGERGR